MRKGSGTTAITALAVLVGIVAGVERVEAQTPIELTKTDVTKEKTISASQWAVLGVRLGESKDAALKTLQRINNISVQDEATAGRIFAYSPAGSKSVVMSLKVVESQVTTINLVGGFGDWLQGDTKALFRAFEDDSLRHKLLGREDSREAVRGGSNEAPTLDVTYAYFKEGLLLHYSVRKSADGKQFETTREMVMIHPARGR
jgi:hypothetical protein